MLTRCWCAFLLGVLAVSAAAQEKRLPRVVLLGDSIRIGYAPFVTKLLDGKAVVISPSPNGQDSGNVLRNLEEWVLKESPDVVHFNAGLHDLKLKDKSYQVPLVEYEKNLKTILERIQKGTKAKVIFATSTPIVDNLHAQRKAGFDRLEADVQKYNIAAVSIMKQAGVPINDLHKLVESGDKQRLVLSDGTHYTQEGYEILGAAVTNSILSSLRQSVGSGIR